MLYHMNFGYPLIDEGARLVYRGAARGYCMYADYSDDELEAVKDIPGPEQRFHGTNEGLVLVEPEADDDGWAHAGVINQQRTLAVDIAFPAAALPRLANWQHFGPGGSYVTALEPFSGSLFGLAEDKHPQADLWLAPGQSRRYQVRLQVHSNPEDIAELTRRDGRLSRPAVS
jgi:hypothetical protein